MDDFSDLPPDYLSTSEVEYDRIKALPLEQRMIEYEKLAAKTRAGLNQSDEAIEKQWEDKLNGDTSSKEAVAQILKSLRPR